MASHGASYEAEHVHSVYEEIASHFSSTRYKVCVRPEFFFSRHALTRSSPGPSSSASSQNNLTALWARMSGAGMGSILR
jgi:hypothetical protein